jgi:hypothetical protein
MTNYLYIAVLSASFLMFVRCSNPSPAENTDVSIEITNVTDDTNEGSQEIVSDNRTTNFDELSLSIGVKENPSEYLPESYFIYDRIAGDLNKDGIADSVYIVKKIDPENIVVNDFDETVDRNRRGLMIFFKHNDSWELAVENLSCFVSENEDGGVYYAPQLTVVIKKGNLFIEYIHGRYGYWSCNFRLNKSDFELIGFDSSQNYGPITVQETSINYLTKRKLTRENIHAEIGDVGNEEFEDTWEGIQNKALLLISEIEDFDELGVY